MCADSAGTLRYFYNITRKKFACQWKNADIWCYTGAIGAICRYEVFIEGENGYGVRQAVCHRHFWAGKAHFPALSLSKSPDSQLENPGFSTD
ncbi:hypothetical protein CE91St42_10310 [Oscillospiraceae bacterium]|nr:hypothetical protein CE91St42_10310 [Oscillospiraceae bacterium]